MRRTLAILAAAVLAVPAAAQAQQNLVEMLRTDIQAQKTQLITATLQLPESTGQRFWPVYRQYSTDLAALNDRRVALIRDWAENSATLTAERANEIARAVLDLDKQRLDLIRRYQDQVRRAAGPLAAARFVQVENLISKLLDVQVAIQLPIIEAPGGQRP
jgi:hypothetical protein